MNDERYIERCLQLAEKGKGVVAPNPMVGAVLVYQDRIIGEGYHQQYGQAHAEVNCFDSVAEQDKQHVCQSTMYVSLEPCAHYGHTPPCANRIMQEEVKRVVICNEDPFEKVSGNGIRILQSNGIEVVTGLLKEKGAWLNRRFFTVHQQRRPYIILKWAQTENGFFAPQDRSRLQMSDEYSTRLSHQWRREEAAIVVGFNTALNDNPQLIARYGEGRQPLRIALDQQLKLPSTHYLLSQDYPTWIVNQQKDELIGNLRFVKLSFDEDLLQRLMEQLYKEQKTSLIVEGGVLLLQNFIDQNLWDEARIFETPNILKEGLKAPVLNADNRAFQTELRRDKLNVILNRNNPFTFFKDLSL